MQFKILFVLLLAWPLSLDAQLLFPGDMNNDGIANHLDLLPLAIAYGTEGPPRPAASFDWFPQKSTPWDIGLPVTGIDLSFVDADGNGFLDSLDLDAIAINYDSTQTDAFPPPMPYILPDTFPVEERPRLSLSINRDEVSANDTIIVSIFLDIPNPDVFPPSNPPTALACRITFDPTYINEEAIFYEPDPSAADLMYVAANVNTVDFGRSVTSGTIEFACGGRGMGALALSRPIGQMIIVIEDMIFLEGDPGFTIEDQVMINLNEEVIDLEVEGDALLVTNTQESPPVRIDIEGFPNPSHGPFFVCPGEFSSAPNISVYDASGRLVHLDFEPVGSCFRTDLTVLSPGVYWMVDDVGGYTRQLTVVKQ
ncbi:MAG: T9SS type A sorting domain-containing protein [Bacteroidota bacterium]